MVLPMSCPICRRKVTELTGDSAKFLPFCGARCRDVDLYRWSSGKYAIVEALPDERLAEELLRQEDSEDFAD